MSTLSHITVLLVTTVLFDPGGRFAKSMQIEEMKFENLVQLADQALYKAKNEGGGFFPYINRR